MIKNATVVGSDIAPSRYNVENAERGAREFTVRSHVLSEIRRNAQRWVRGYVSPESKSKEFGSLYDCLLLTPKQYPSRYCMTPATYTNKDGEQTKWRNDKRVPEVAKWLEDHKGLQVVDCDLSATVHGAIRRLREDPLICDLIDSSAKSVMVTCDWEDKATGITVPCKALIDIVPPKDHPVFSNSLWDLKSTKNASPWSFAGDAQRYSYNLQGALYVDLYNAATGEARSDFGHVVQENYSPYEYRTPPPLLSQRFLDFGRQCYQAALALYCQCLATGKWPSYERGSAWPITDCADWLLNPEAVYGPLEADEPEEAPETDVYGPN